MKGGNKYLICTIGFKLSKNQCAHILFPHTSYMFIKAYTISGKIYIVLLTGLSLGNGLWGEGKEWGLLIFSSYNSILFMAL